MSRHYAAVSGSAFASLLDKRKAKKVPSELITVVHGYDEPCRSYFCDLLPDCEIGIYYGGIGLTKELTRGEYLDAMKLLNIPAAIEAVALDLPY